jgi:hypothetical protein
MSVIVVAWSSRLRNVSMTRRADVTPALDVGDLDGDVLGRLRQLGARPEVLESTDNRPELGGW